MKRYDPKAIESKWQKNWRESRINAAKDFDAAPKFVMLTEFPYPSGSGMHIGHMREYTLGDIIARHKRMNGFNTLFPMGYDAFGLPTENYAIKNKISPEQATEENTAVFQQQLESMGFSFDWERSFKTTDPDYYKWTQWLFLQFFKAGLAYQEESSVNWCPFCKTGLANEEVVNGRHERCDTIVEKKKLKQWMLRITDYADSLIEGLKELDFTSRVSEQQINWIGKSTGAEISFKIKGFADSVSVYTTRPDTLFGATFIVMAPEHPLIATIVSAEQKDKIDSYIKEVQSKTAVERQEAEKQKTGVFTGAYALNPVTGEQLPIWIAEYILMEYGTGAIMAVPAHDKRDYEFAQIHSLPVKRVIEPKFITTSGESAVKQDLEFIKREVICAVVYDPSTDRYLCVKWKTHKMNGLVTGGVDEGEDPVSAAIREIKEETGYVELKLANDPGIYIHSLFYQRQKKINRWARFHYLFFTLVNDTRAPVSPKESGLIEPVWLTRAELDNFFTVIEGQYLLELLDDPNSPYSGEGVMTGSGKYDGMDSEIARTEIVSDLAAKRCASEKTNYRLRDWIFSRQRYWGEPIPIIHCETHGAVAVADKDLPVVLPPLRDFQPDESGQSPLAQAKDWVNTVCPICNKPAKRETDTMPNWAGSSWYYLRYFDPHNDREFADKDLVKYWGPVDLYLGGTEHITLHLLYSRFWNQFLFDQGLVSFREPYRARRSQGIILAADNTKMSKSRGNVVNPSDILDKGYGADALRLAISFLAPYDQTTPWSPESLAGTFRFLQRFWTLSQEYLDSEGGNQESLELKQTINRTLKRINADLENMGFNTAIAALMECLNALYRIKSTDNFQAIEWQWAIETFTQMLAPFAPHISEEVWQNIGGEGSVHISPWPKLDEQYTLEDELIIAVQINGKIRGEVKVAIGASQEEIEKAAFASDQIKRSLAGKNIERTIYIKGKLLSIVVR